MDVTGIESSRRTLQLLFLHEMTQFGPRLPERGGHRGLVVCVCDQLPAGGPD